MNARSRTGWRAPLACGAVGSALVALGGFGAGAVPVDGGPAAWLGLPGATFGHGSFLALAVCWVGVALLVGAWLRIGPAAVSGRLPTRTALTAVAAWSLPFLPAVPVFSRDAWSYLAQGAMLAAGVSPYEHGPGAVPGVFTDEVSPDWRSTATPYGPAHLALLRGIVAASGGSPYVGVLLLRLAVFAALAGLCWGLVALARRAGVPPAAAVWAGAASPLAVLHFAGGLHNEIFALVGAVAAVVAALDGRAWRAAACTGAAIAVKVTAVLVAPFLLWMLLHAHRRRTGRARAGAARTAGYLAVTALVPLAVVAGLSLLTGTGSGWLAGLAVSDRVVNYLSVPTALAHVVAACQDAVGFDDVLAATRDGGRVVLAGVLVVLWWVHRRSAADALRGVLLALLAFVLLNSVSWPWYHTWPAAFWVAARPGPRADALGVGAVVFLVLAIGPNGSTSLYSPGLAAVAAVAALVTGVWWLRVTERDRSPGAAAPRTGDGSQNAMAWARRITSRAR